MSSTLAPRVQFVVSGKFLALFLLAGSLLGGGYYWYSRQQQLQKRFQAPPYFVNTGPNAWDAYEYIDGTAVNAGKPVALTYSTSGKLTGVTDAAWTYLKCALSGPFSATICGCTGSLSARRENSG